MFFSNLTWQSELVTNGYSPDLPSTALSFPDTLILRVRELVPAYQLVTANEQLSINSLGFLVSSSRMPDQTYQFVLSDPNLALQIETARSVPENLHASLLTTIQKLNSLSINFSSLQLVADSTLLIELTPQLWALTDSSDPASLDRLQQIMTSNQLPLEEGQLYELDTRFSHPVLRKRL